MAKRDEPATTGHAALRHLGGGNTGIFLFLHAPGVLRHPRTARTGFTDRRLAATGRRIARNFRVAAQWPNRLDGVARPLGCHLGNGDVPAGAEQERACRQRPSRPAQEEPERIRARVWAHLRSNAASTGTLSEAADDILDCVVRRHSAEPAVPAAEFRPGWQLGIDHHDLSLIHISEPTRP